MRKVLKTMVIAGWQTDKLHKKNIIDKQNQHQFCMSYRVQGCSISLRHIRSFFFFFFYWSLLLQSHSWCSLSYYEKVHLYYQFYSEDTVHKK